MENFIQKLIPWIFTHGIKIFGILITVYLINRTGVKIIERIIRKGVKDTTREATEKRQNTLIGVLAGAFKIIIWLVAITMILPELGINVGPILAGAGILGVALGFGAQYMIRDFLAGLFIIIENQYREGDVVCLDGTCGLVEDITLRKTILRDLDGIVHHLPNGEIKKSSNLSKQFARVNLNVGISYKANLEKVVRVVDQVGRKLAEDPGWKDSIIKPPQFLRIDNFGDSAIIIKILGETKPLKQWDVTGELRKRIKIAFDKEGIEIPYQQVVIHQVRD
ncbi:MAG: mechanosensitive ion channel family protein [Candidatus Nealsonbacteria bacterium CG_4_10_14_0_2_um_filter_35_20]|uniref:Mechanosensitive ion channel family protein n=2 Tax=Candidatus Nealsoniibacteriota TaxID=1817911 RepID=A0A2M7DAG5_9BACT|nr:MAG: mechanosensitive ion channel family protein [Candidatus Nealsonbacteria bacterium CG02_land_8_20_14_3_00_34_20]PIW92523.1 MAG: mechanosensitive ion channel family protein [Candidatus Nealsonbacteria bacterium CG_4_8_14_3_um_filter_34_13]PIZ89749.1 MAG: mechanosensitive ion channel family protein [Candidatus Nealsonbacteria bacterium CG_4_10_14_0_2_um_filter_35_20]